MKYVGLFFMGFVPSFIVVMVIGISNYKQKPLDKNSDIIIFDPIEISEDIHMSPLSHMQKVGEAGRDWAVFKATN